MGTGEPTGEVQARQDTEITLPLIGADRLVDAAVVLVEGGGELVAQQRAPDQCIVHAVADDGILEMAGIADERPSRSCREPEIARQLLGAPLLGLYTYPL